MKTRAPRWRKVKSWIMIALCVGCVALALVPLLSLLVTAVQRGWPALTTPGFLTGKLVTYGCNPSTDPSCTYGGIGDAIIGTLIVVGFACLISLPIGVIAGIYMSEYGGRRLAGALRFIVEVMTGIPSIVVGIFIFAVIILAASEGWLPPQLAQSVIAGALALSVLMIPIVARTTDESLRLVPHTVREASLALGIPHYRSVVRIVLSTGRSAVVTGMLLGLARAAGETAPLLVTMGFSAFAFAGLNEPAASLPTVIYNYGFLSPFGNFQAVGWGAAVVLVGLMLAISIAARMLFWTRARKLGMEVL